MKVSIESPLWKTVDAIKDEEEFLKKFLRKMLKEKRKGTGKMAPGWENALRYGGDPYNVREGSIGKFENKIDFRITKNNGNPSYVKIYKPSPYAKMSAEIYRSDVVLTKLIHQIFCDETIEETEFEGTLKEKEEYETIQLTKNKLTKEREEIVHELTTCLNLKR